jgi:hypothetical protein
MQFAVNLAQELVVHQGDFADDALNERRHAGQAEGGFEAVDDRGRYLFGRGAGGGGGVSICIA